MSINIILKLNENSNVDQFLTESLLIDSFDVTLVYLPDFMAAVVDKMNFDDIVGLGEEHDILIEEDIESDEDVYSVPPQNKDFVENEEEKIW